jgi:hypothetical protein
MIKSIFGKFAKWKILKQIILKDIDTLIIGSMGIVSFISFFVGGVVSIQTALNLENPLLPKKFNWLCNQTIGYFRICSYLYLYYYGR